MQISEAFKRFGSSDGDESVLVVLVHDKDDPQLLSDIAARVSGRQVPAEDVSSLSDHAKIKKVLHLGLNKCDSRYLDLLCGFCFSQDE